MSQPDGAKPKANLFDIRNVVGALLLIYGVVLVIVSFSTSDAERAKVSGINANLWVGICLLAFGALMVAWAVTRPIVVDEKRLEEDRRAIEEAAGRAVDDEGGAGGVG
jgi:hypothetical protein